MIYNIPIFPGSSMVEQEAVNFEVTGSSPVRGAKEISRLLSRYFFVYSTTGPEPTIAGSSSIEDERKNAYIFFRIAAPKVAISPKIALSSPAPLAQIPIKSLTSTNSRYIIELHSRLLAIPLIARLGEYFLFNQN